MGILYLLLKLAAVVIVAQPLLYMLMIMPRIWHKPSSAPFRKWYYAHRGLHDNESDAPENSMAAFAKAVEAGYGIELDIRLSKDRIPVVFHDETLSRVCGVEGRVSDYTYEELQQFPLCNSAQHIPKFEDVLRLVDGRVPLIVEFKMEYMDMTLCPIADRLLREYRGLYCMESFNPIALWWFRCHHGKVMRGQLADAFSKEGTFRGPAYFVVQNLLVNFIGKPDFVAYHHIYYSVLSRRICRRLYHNTAVAWTIKSQEELNRARKHFDIFIFDSFLPQT